ncbi:MAG: HAD-IIIA family hydrolase [Nitrospira sp.]|nr:HAD-IIIA family hydrolase [bacterium]MBL7048184.1 HAD-IIIA family hydrolase [Nitrospira sp.]
MHYLNSFEKLEILPGVREGLDWLRNAGFKLIGITNQSGIARGIVDEDFVLKSNQYLLSELGLDDFYYCPHHPDEGCRCRKPAAELAFTAASKHNLDLNASFVIGDSESDILLAVAIDAKGVLISADTDTNQTAASFITTDITHAADWILTQQ